MCQISKYIFSKCFLNFEHEPPFMLLKGSNNFWSTSENVKSNQLLTLKWPSKVWAFATVSSSKYEVETTKISGVFCQLPARAKPCNFENTYLFQKTPSCSSNWWWVWQLRPCRAAMWLHLEGEASLPVHRTASFPSHDGFVLHLEIFPCAVQWPLYINEKYIWLPRTNKQQKASYTNNKLFSIQSKTKILQAVYVMSPAMFVKLESINC